MPNKLNRWYDSVKVNYPYLYRESFYRLILLYCGVNYKNQDSYPDPFTHYEIIYTATNLSTDPVLTFLQPKSPFSLIDTGGANEKILLFENNFISTVTDCEIKFFDNRNNEPFYFYVREIKDELVLKLNPVQLCDFFQNSKGMKPCNFCFRNDMVSRFRNISAEELVRMLLDNEMQKDKQKALKSIDELSIVTGSYKNDGDYLNEVSVLVKGLKPHISNNLRVVVGSHEGKTKFTYENLKKAGITVFAFPLESLDDDVRQKNMKNRKGIVPIKVLIKYVEEAISIFGEEGVIIRLVAGMGDKLTEHFEGIVKYLSRIGRQYGPYWNINEYMPFTHYHWRLFNKKRPFDLDYLFKYCNIINKYVPQERQLRFKISP